MHAVPTGSNAEHEAAGSSCEPAPVASVLLQGAQAMLLRQQQQEEAAHAAVYAANTALLGAQVSLHVMQALPRHSTLHISKATTSGCRADHCLDLLPSPLFTTHAWSLSARNFL